MNNFRILITRYNSIEYFKFIFRKLSMWLTYLPILNTFFSILNILFEYILFKYAYYIHEMLFKSKYAKTGCMVCIILSRKLQRKKNWNNNLRRYVRYLLSKSNFQLIVWPRMLYGTQQLSCLLLVKKRDHKYKKKYT